MCYIGPILRWGVVVFLVALVVYGLTTFGALRSPDSEVVYEVCAALADHGTFAVEGVSTWPGFGLAPGRDGRMYSVFGVGQSLACVPVLWAGRALGLAGDGAPRNINPSFYVERGHRKFMDHEPAQPLAPHGDRFVASYLNVLAGALGVWVFFLIARRLSSNVAAALAVTALYAFGTLAWPYAGFCFSEPLATLFVLLSLLGLLHGDDGRSTPWVAVASGLALGCAVATHVTAILFAPFFLAYAWRRRALPFGAGLCVVLALIGWYDLARFGSVLETGRAVDPALAERFGYGHAVAPWRGLLGLSFGGGKSLFVFVPAVVWGIWAWRSFRRTHRALAWLVLGSALARILFIASRSDWHGGFCLGPRLLLMIVPLLLLPVVPWLGRALAERRKGVLVAFAVGAWVCVAEQIEFVLGEPFTFYRRIVEIYSPRGVNVFAGDRLYTDWAFTPITRLLIGPRGPWLLHGVPLSNGALWAVIALLAAGVCAVALRKA
jgi:hypothetical protein